MNTQPSPGPPPWASRLLDRITRGGDRLSIAGDIQETFSALNEDLGPVRARLWLIGQIFLAAAALTRHRLSWRIDMLWNTIKIAGRNMRRHKAFSLINIIGLTAGISGFLMIGLYVRDELSYDDYHENANRIHRITVDGLVNDMELRFATCCAPMAPTLPKECPEVEAAARLRRFGNPKVRFEDRAFSEKRWYWADPSLFDVFTIPFLAGDPRTALIEPHSVVLTESTAARYFDGEDPIGRILVVDDDQDWRVTGVMADIPRNSHVHFDFLAALTTLEDSRNQNWLSNNYPTYVLLREGADPKTFTVKLQSLLDKYVMPMAGKMLDISPDAFYAGGGRYEYILQPLRDIHLRSHLRFEHEPNGDMVYVTIFSWIAIAILLIAAVNFINLATARAATRAREVGVRKTVGSSRGRLIRRFIGESILLSCFAAGLALPLIGMLLPTFNRLTGKSFSLSAFLDPALLPAIAGIAILTGLLAGTYPAFHLSSFHPVSVLKGRIPIKHGGSRLRNGLVVSQFAVSVFLIIGTLTVREQMNYIQRKKLGFEREHLLVIQNAGDLRDRIRPFKRDLIDRPDILSAAACGSLMGGEFSDNSFRRLDRPRSEILMVYTLWADPDFLETFGLDLIDGRFFSPHPGGNRRDIVINQAAANALGLTDPVNMNLSHSWREGEESTIVGVVRDFHFRSLHQTIMPLAIQPLDGNMYGGYLAVRLDSRDIRKTLAGIRSIWNRHSGGQAFEYEFYDDYFARTFLAESRTGHVFLVFAALAILISSMGLLGLTAFVVEQRRKEIGIRKILGASPSGISLLLGREYGRWVLAANLIAWPAAWLAMRKWLGGFAYRIEPGIGIFLSAGLLAAFFALLTVSGQTVRAAGADPVKSLRTE